VKRALMNSCSVLEEQCPFGQGHGLLSIEKAWLHLSAHAAAPERDVRFAVTCNGKASKGIHLRGTAALKAAEYAVKVEPIFLDADNRPAKVLLCFSSVLWIRIPIRKIVTFLGLPDPGPLDRGTHPRIRILTKMSRIHNTVFHRKGRF
jgi:hypothetical protein